MSDRDEIFDLTVRYATAIDSRQYDLLATVFTEKADLDYGVIGHWKSAAEITDFMERAHVGAEHTLHRMSNQMIAIDGDCATVRTYVDALILFPGGGANPVGYYDDYVVRTSEGWRIARRSYTSVRIVGITTHG
jgi:hypothetical protein